MEFIQLNWHSPKFITDKDILNIIQELGIEYAQGFQIAKPDKLKKVYIKD